MSPLACRRLVVSPRPTPCAPQAADQTPWARFSGGMMVMNDASKWHIMCPAQSHTAGQSRGRAQQRLPPPLLACAQQIARCGGRLGVYYTFWRVSGAGPSTSYPAGTHMSPGEQGSGVCAKSGVLKQARRAPTAGFERAKNRSRQSTKTCKRFGPAASFLLASARDLRFSPRAIQQGNVGLLGTQNGIFRSARA